MLTHSVTFNSELDPPLPPPPPPPGSLTKKLWNECDSLSAERPRTDSADRTAQMGMMFLEISSDFLETLLAYLLIVPCSI